MFALWDLVWVGDAKHGLLDYVTRGTAFLRTEAEAARLITCGNETRNLENRYRHKSGGYSTLFWGATAIPDEGLIYAIA